MVMGFSVSVCHCPDLKFVLPIAFTRTFSLYIEILKSVGWNNCSSVCVSELDPCLSGNVIAPYPVYESR